LEKECLKEKDEKCGVVFLSFKKIREILKDSLRDEGDLDTKQLKERVNEKFKHGTTMSEIGNILSGDKTFTKTGKTNSYKGEVGGGSYEVKIWHLEE
tara:strand:+ start:107 stop:397 length:291 start_codon:yes stop_codon:yes gene_type:complete